MARAMNTIALSDPPSDASQGVRPVIGTLSVAKAIVKGEEEALGGTG